MYQLTPSPFGKFERYTLRHSQHGHSISFIPERGGCLLSLIYNDQEIIDGYQTPEEVDFNNWGKSGVLYPFPNRLAGGQYHWQGKDYQFPVNDIERNNALHGFGMTRALSIVAKELSEHEALIRMEGRYGGELDYYPWPFTFGLTYQLLAPNQLIVTLSARNDSDETIPMGLGWHPYFQLDETAAACRLQLQAVAMVGIDARMIPTGKRYAFIDYAQEKLIGSTILDNCFALSPKKGRSSAYLSGQRGKLHYWQETGADKFNFLQVFTPPYGTSIALEPMSCNVDAFNNGDGLKSLEPGETLSARVGVELS